jgi:hypothetical protein
MRKRLIKHGIAISGIAILTFFTVSCALFTYTPYDVQQPRESQSSIASDYAPTNVVGNLEGHWGIGATGYKFNGNNFEYNNDNWSGYKTLRGTFTYTATHITFYPTHVFEFSFSGGESWELLSEVSEFVLYNEFKSFFFDETPVPYSFREIVTPLRSAFRLTINGVEYGYLDF